MAEIRLAVLEDQGPRSHMEDRHFFLKIKESGIEGYCLLGGIFDGHDGAEVSSLAIEEISKVMPQHICGSKDPNKVMSDLFLDISEKAKKKYESGSTALMFYIREKKMYVANAGDSRLVIFRKDKIEQVTADHRVDNLQEKRRILNAGGEIDGSYVWKGNSGLMPTRSLGDPYFSDVGVIANPESFIVEAPSEKGEYFVAATDGLWDDLPNKSVAEFCQNAKNPEAATKNIFTDLVNLGGPNDNITLIVGMVM
jgi:serine/threonine protein phosphatase PrpC